MPGSDTRAAVGSSSLIRDFSALVSSGLVPRRGAKDRPDSLGGSLEYRGRSSTGRVSSRREFCDARARGQGTVVLIKPIAGSGVRLRGAGRIAEPEEEGQEMQADYVIVGAGSGGCVLANRLTEDPATRVVL